MANWKEIGEVPDSDDEGSLDSEHDIFLDASSTNLRFNESHGEHNDIAINKNDAVEYEAADSRQGDALDGAVTTPVGHSTPRISATEGNDKDNLPPLLSSPISAFKDPRDIWMLVEDRDHDVSSLHIPREEHPTDEVSRSYVRVTSTMSSVLSSLPPSQVATEIDQQEAGSEIGPNPGTHNLNEPQNRKRSFRQRNLIQLYPYGVEQQKYMRDLKARGLKPVRLIQAQEERRENHQGGAIQKQSSQEQDSQDAEFETEESQPDGVFLNSSPPSVIANHSLEAGNRDSHGSGDEDDDFPDIDELIKKHNQALKNVKPRHHLKSYSTKNRRFEPSRPRNMSAGSQVRDSANSHIPVSPPTTSSPFRAVNNSAHAPLSDTFEDQDFNSSLDDVETTIGKLRAPLTPVTSAVKPLPILIDSDTDMEAVHASHEPVSPSMSSSDESVQIRKVGKKIRGVLPASHVRLDQQLKKPLPPQRYQRDSSSASPAKPSPRRGVALPVKSKGGIGAPSIGSNFPLFSDDASETSSDDDRHDMGDDFPQLDPVFTEPQRMGYADEDDRIDAMLPSGQRQGRGPDIHPRKKRRVLSMASRRTGGHVRQPKITEHLPRAWKASSTTSGAAQRPTNRRKRQAHSYNPHAHQPAAIQLSILDVTSSSRHEVKDQPRFIRIAARTARSKKNQGRQSPTRKCIRLANREDTIDAQSVLQDWRAGRINQRPLTTTHTTPPSVPLGQISGNAQTTIPGPRPGNIGESRSRKLILSKVKQRTMNEFVTSSSPNNELLMPRPQAISADLPHKKHQKSRPFNLQSRPAQLESTELEYSYRHPSAAFGSSKKALDTLYRSVRKRPQSQVNLQLSRFLADNDVIRPSTEIKDLLVEKDDQPDTEGSVTAHRSRTRKRRPQRIDAGAAIYRQPSEPLVLELLLPTKSRQANESKLAGLGKFGTRYPIHFDISPLRPGIFFHRSTFIGSGYLLKIIQNDDFDLLDNARPTTSVTVGERSFQWGLWNENVSSEVGLCFDWLLDQLLVRTASSSTSATENHTEPIIHSMIDYIQHSIRFSALEGGLDFLSRMHTILNDFTSRFKAELEDLGHLPSTIKVMAKCTVLAFQLLQFSNKSTEYWPMKGRLEDLLGDVSSFCIKLLLLRGVEDVRKLFDDLQYFSFRENGIKETQYTSHAWVMQMRVLTAARLFKKSFWEVTNTQLLDNDLLTVNDARIIEKTWYTMVSLLPLCEFDESGVIIQGARHRASFDNWRVPQQLIKRVLSFYSLNPRQVPGFNDYCRALFTRCHFLMVEWGWWKSGALIGALFDFFASHGLAHLRNEEVYRSPKFLDELDDQPNLAIDNDDRCFHIFLKIVAQSLSYLRRAGQAKDIRNLVFRLLPNHDRQYPKENDILECELAALRNHHDLLCTLFWAAPPDQRPSLSLIQDLVDADRSHNAACLINLKAWNQLARFVLKSSTPSGSLGPFIVWQDLFFDKIRSQYLEEDTNTRRQADLNLVPGAALITETQLRNQILANRKSTMVTLRRVLRNVLDAVTYAQNYSDLLDAFNIAVLAPSLTLDFEDNCINDVVKIVMTYMDQVDRLHPYVEPQVVPISKPTEDDSQLSIDMDLNMDRQILIFPLCNKILPILHPLSRRILDGHAYPDEQLPWLPTLIQCWARLASLAAEQSFKLEEFFPGGSKSIFSSRIGLKRVKLYWPLFLAEMLQTVGLRKLFIKDKFDIYLEWLVILTDPDPVYESTLSLQLRRCNCFLITPVTHSTPRIRLLKDSIDILRQLYQTSRNGNPCSFQTPADSPLAMPIDISSREMHAYFSHILKEVMTSMQEHLEIMIPGTVAHSKYLKFCQDVISHIRSRAGNIQPLTKYFMTTSTKYWPEESDPTLYAAGIISYCLRLGDDEPARVSSELFHYLWRGWRHDLIARQMQNHVAYISKGLTYFDFFEFMISNYVPAVIHVGFENDYGWVASSTYLPPLAKRIIRGLEQGSVKSTSVFRSSINLLKLIVNGIIKQSTKQGTIKGVHPNNRGIISVTCQFWISIVPSLQAYVEDHADLQDIYQEVSNALVSFLLYAELIFSKGQGVGEWDVELLNVTEGPQVNDFVAMITSDINSSWSMGTGDTDGAMALSNGWIEILGSSSGGRTSHRVELDQIWGRTLLEVLGVGICRGLPSLYPDQRFPDQHAHRNRDRGAYLDPLNSADELLF